MQDEAGETERLRLYLLKRAWSHRRQTCQRENKFSGDGVTGSMDGVAIQP